MIYLILYCLSSNNACFINCTNKINKIINFNKLIKKIFLIKSVSHGHKGLCMGQVPITILIKLIHVQTITKLNVKILYY